MPCFRMEELMEVWQYHERAFSPPFTFPEAKKGKICGKFAEIPLYLDRNITNPLPSWKTQKYPCRFYFFRKCGFLWVKHLNMIQRWL